MLDPIYIADHVEAHRVGINLISVAGLICELVPIISKYGVGSVRRGLEKMFEDLPSGFPIRFVSERGTENLLVLSRQQSDRLSLRRLHRGMKEPDRLTLELMLFELVASDLLKLINPMPL